MNKNYLFMALVFLASGLVGCSDDDDSYDWYGAHENEKERLAEYVKDKNPKQLFEYKGSIGGKDFVANAYVFNYKQEGVRAGNGDFVLYNYVRKTLDGTILDATYPSVAVGSDVTPLVVKGGPIYMFMKTNDSEIDPMADVFEYIPEGTKAEALYSSLTPGFWGGSTYFYYEYTVEKVIKDMTLLAYESKLMNDFLVSVEDEIKGDIIKLPLNEGSGKDTITQVAKILVESDDKTQVELTDSVTVHYDAYILDEINEKNRVITEMEEEEKATLYLSGMIEGFKRGVANMRVGEEAYILVPSGMGYSYNGWKNYEGQYLIPPYATLLYKVKVLSTKKNPAKN